jgi:hypothetical protein
LAKLSIGVILIQSEKKINNQISVVLMREKENIAMRGRALLRNNFMRYLLSWLILFSILLLPGVSPARGDGNNTLAASALITVSGDVTAAGVGLRGTGTGSINISTIPGAATVLRAYLYWGTIGSANTFTTPTLNGSLVNGDLIGTSGDTCWGAQNNFVYRADVTNNVTGNGTYTIAGLPSNLTFGNDSQGASLVIIYELSGAPLRTIVINDGAVSLNFVRTSYTDTVSGFNPDNPVTDAHITYLIGDGQAQWDAGNLTFNGTSIASGIFSGVDGNYWGTHTFNVTGLVETSTNSTTLNNTDPGNPASPDCLLWAATIFSVTAADLPEPENDLSQFMNRSIIGDVTASGVGLRGRGEGTIALDGLPEGAIVLEAYLYWATIGNSGSYTQPAINGAVVNGQVIGVSADTCWGAMRNFVYRAEVTPHVRSNGLYTISGLPSNLNIGNDSQGASLVVLYRLSGLRRTVIINDGAVTLDLVINSYTDTIGDFFADQPMAEAHITYLVGDGQERWSTGAVMFEGTSIANNVFTGVDGDYWGTLTFDITGRVTEPSSTTTINNLNPLDPDSPDCLVWAATIFSVETERDVVLSQNFFMPLIVTGAIPQN